MPNPLASIDPLVHPHQMEIQDFASYTLVIDARSAAAYREDRLPCAINIPAAKAGPSPANRLVAAPPHKMSTLNEPPPMPHALAPHASRLVAGDTVLVYCDRGGLDSMVWAAPLQAAGMRVDVLGGGWINYRRWVDAGLELLPRVLTFRRLLAPPANRCSTSPPLPGSDLSLGSHCQATNPRRRLLSRHSCLMICGASTRCGRSGCVLARRRWRD
jgi:rhodanese-related sulfurtransferase